jgi:NADPH:quinone reductase-like Zn-dependent oxidoreductase
MKIIINGHKAEVDTELLAKAIAINYADWKAYKGKAEKVAKMLPDIINIDKSLF